MPFEELQKRVSIRADETPATISISATKGGKSRCYLTLRAAFVADIGWKGCEVSAAIGSGADSGKMRVARKQGGAFCLRVTGTRNVGMIDLGHVAQFGNHATGKIGVGARKIDKDTFEVDLPNFAEHVDDTPPRQRKDVPDERDQEQPVLHVPIRSAAVPQAPKPAPQTNGSAPITAVEHTGVRVTGGAKPMIAHQGERFDLTPRQARVLAMLTKSLGSMLPTATLIQKVGLNMSAGAAQISDDYFALKTPLLDLGLKLTFTPKMGYTLAKA